MYNLNVLMNYNNDDKYREQLLELYELDTYDEKVILKRMRHFWINLVKIKSYKIY